MRAKAVENGERQVRIKVKRISHHEAAVKAVAEVGDKSTLRELAARADALFVAGGGESRLDTAVYDVRRVLETAEALGRVKLTRPADILVAKAK